MIIDGDFCPYPRNLGLELNPPETSIFTDFYNKMASEQEDIPREFEETFRKHHKDLLAKF